MADRPTDPAAQLTTPDAFAGLTVLVCGTGMAGRSAIAALLDLGARVLVTSDGGTPAPLPPAAAFLGPLTALPVGVDAVVASPGLPPTHPVLAAADVAGVPVFGELEFAWRIQGSRRPRWLMVTGTNGKTTTVRMLESILRAAGLRAAAVGNVGVPIIDAVRADPAYDVLAVEASSFQLHFSSSVRPWAGALLNLAEDHLDWHGSMAAYARVKTKVWAGDWAIGNADDELVAARLGEVPTARLTFWLGPPGTGRYGVAGGMLTTPDGIPLLPATEVAPPGPHNIANALAAAALAGAAGIGPAAVAAGLRAFVPDPHRNELVAERAGVRYVDDSKATNPHAAAASLAAYPRIVWIAGGQLKGADVEPLVAAQAARLAGAVLVGTDRAAIAAALSRHAPHLPVIDVARTDDGAMGECVAAAASLAVAGDVVLLAPAAASKDMFTGYGERGLAFQAAVRALPDPGAAR